MDSEINKKLSPFTCTPGRAGHAFIDNIDIEEIIDNFESDYSDKHIYKILGLRGSGKSVLYQHVIKHFAENKDWLVYSLTTDGDQIKTLISCLSKESFIMSEEVSTNISSETKASGNLLAIQGSETVNISATIKANDKYYSDEATLKDMLKKASEKYKILIGIDDIAKKGRMTEFLTILRDVVLDYESRVYLICTGLETNIADFSSESHLTFFVRGDQIVIEPFSRRSVSIMYQNLLGIDASVANDMADIVKGYAYAYQLLGELYFKKKETETLDDLTNQLDLKLGLQYDVIWKTLTKEEQSLVELITVKGLTATADIKKAMPNSNSYPELRKRLINKHVLFQSSYGYVQTVLPRLKEYIETK